MMNNYSFVFEMNPSIAPDLSVMAPPVFHNDIFSDKKLIIDHEALQWSNGYYDCKKGNACFSENEAYIDGYSYSYQQQQMESNYDY